MWRGPDPEREQIDHTDHHMGTTASCAGSRTIVRRQRPHPANSGTEGTTERLQDVYLDDRAPQQNLPSGLCPSAKGKTDGHQGALRFLPRYRRLGGPPALDDPVALAWADVRTRYRVPSQYAHQLMDGVAMDFVVRRYATFDELAEYSYGVASTVGLMAMHIIGFRGPEAIPYAIKLGVSLQITNILRDVAEDWRSGRLYLPQEDLSAFDLDEADIAAGRVDDRWRAFMRFQVERNRRLYAEALPGIALLHADGRFAIEAAAELYQAILEDIEARGGDVFSRRAYVSRWGKAHRLPGIWWRARRARTT
jgi:phytoene/squalene synthetase